MASSPSTLIACAALLVSGCAIGLLLGRWTGSTTAAEHSPPEAQAQPQDLKPILEDIRRAVEALPQAIRERRDPQPASGGAREAMPASPDTFAELTAAVQRLNTLLDRGAINAGGGRPGAAPWKGAGYPSLESMWQRIDVLHQGDPQSVTGSVNSELIRLHLAWTREDVFERYGAPTAVYPGERGIGVVYKRDAKPSEPSTIQFMINEGLVVYVNIDR
jgi:hypothetical protein